MPISATAVRSASNRSDGVMGWKGFRVRTAAAHAWRAREGSTVSLSPRLASALTSALAEDIAGSHPPRVVPGFSAAAQVKGRIRQPDRAANRPSIAALQYRRAIAKIEGLADRFIDDGIERADAPDQVRANRKRFPTLRRPARTRRQAFW